MGMKLCVYGITKKFPTIKNLTTNVLVSKMNPATVAQDEKEKDVQGKVLLLVCENELLKVKIYQFSNKIYCVTLLLIFLMILCFICLALILL